jgi:hypothetical protein
MMSQVHPISGSLGGIEGEYEYAKQKKQYLGN